MSAVPFFSVTDSTCRLSYLLDRPANHSLSNQLGRLWGKWAVRRLVRQEMSFIRASRVVTH